MNERVARLKQWRGLPVPFFVTYKPDGTPDFKVVDDQNRLRCAREKLCWICGEVLSYRFVFLGGPQSAMHRMYVDGPMHEECALDALQLCPFMIGRTDYAKSTTVAEVQTFKSVDPKPPEELVVYTTRGFKIQHLGAEWCFYAAPATSLELISRFKENR